VSLLGLSLILASCGGGSSPAPVAFAYVAHPQSWSLSVISIPADKTVSNVEIGTSSSSSLTTTASDPTGVAVTPDRHRIYVTDAISSVWVVDTGSNSVIAKIAAGSDPEAIAITPDGKSAYVTSITCGLLLCSGPSNPPQMASVEVIDTASNSLKATITIGEVPEVLLNGIAISPDGARAYVANGVGNQIWAIDTASNQIATMIPTAVSQFYDVSISPDGRRLYAAGITNGPVVEVIDTKADDVIASIVLPSTEVPPEAGIFANPPLKIAITLDGDHAYVTGFLGSVWIVDTTTNAAVAVPVSVGNPLLDVAFTPDGTRAYISCGNTNTIYVLDTATYNVVASVPSLAPGGLAIAPTT
ncbi:MAG TPA: SMP-30/gluconolactonase/LRE family protein, partial [Terriglobia bacterium]|nr:SMP-30/gluconolactonase/LRE family protein [Terriglobia bacterium]